MLLCELRSNPDRNPRVGILDVLRQYKDRSDVFVTFTAINKLGINPQSRYNTPLGIYSYPVKELWDTYLDWIDPNTISIDNLDGHIPYAAESRYAILFSCQDEHVLNEETYSDDDLDRDLKKLEDMTSKYLPSSKTMIKMFKSLSVSGTKRTRAFNALSTLWRVTRDLADELATAQNRKVDRVSAGSDATTKIWNGFFRGLGISGIADRHGRGIIHPNEPIQAVFFSTEKLKVIGTYLNKHHAPGGNEMKKALGMPINKEKKETKQVDTIVKKWFFNELFGRHVDPNNKTDFDFIVDQLKEKINGPVSATSVLVDISRTIPSLTNLRNSLVRKSIGEILHHRYSGQGAFFQNLYK